ncbi:MAG: hypothetical protein M3389_01775, partial [Actinomycetota bacterium]|nr:hypothetical protein [Actinomycetota bacterium]
MPSPPATGAGEAAEYLQRRFRLPPDIPEVAGLPRAGEGEVLVRHHCSEKVVGRFVPATGRVGGLV